MADLYPLPTIHPDIASLLRLLHNDLIVIGSVARRDRPLLSHMSISFGDGWIGGVERHNRNGHLIRKSNLRFDSVYPMNWHHQFDANRRIIPVAEVPTDIQLSFTALKRRSSKHEIGGVSLWVAPPQFAGQKAKDKLRT